MDVDIEPAHPHVHPHTGHAWLDKILPVCALFVSFVSIFIAAHHGQVMQELVHQNERLVQANSLPHLQLDGSNTSETGEPRVRFSVTNAGVGPAEIRSVQVLVAGRPVGDIGALMRACCGVGQVPGLTTSTLLGGMVRPGQTISFIDLPVTSATSAVAARLDRARTSNRILTKVCYCSVFDECWARSSAAGDRPRRVAQCSAPQPQYSQ